MTEQVDLRRAGGCQDLVHKVRELLRTVFHLVKAIEDGDVVLLAVAQREHAVAFEDESGRHVQPIVNTIQGQTVDKDKGERMGRGGLAVPVVPTSGTALDQALDQGSRDAGSGSFTLGLRKRGGLNHG